MPTIFESKRVGNFPYLGIDSYCLVMVVGLGDYDIYFGMSAVSSEESTLSFFLDFDIMVVLPPINSKLSVKYMPSSQSSFIA